MLVVTQRKSQKVYIGDPHGAFVVLTIVDVGEGRVRLGFDGPRDVRVVRGELLTPEQIAAFENALKFGK